jgi:hypothetical protein
MAEFASESAQPDAGGTACWCCGRRRPDDDVIHLGDHPEVAVCLGCAHFLHQQALAREDASAPSPGSRVRDGLRAARRFVVRRGWHEKPGIGPALRRLGDRLP